VVHTYLGQQGAAGDHLKQAQQYFQLVGSSSSECDTIPGRQAMASCFFLLKQFEDVLIFLQVGGDAMPLLPTNSCFCNIRVDSTVA
jgi:intraflagellar transport protein 56